MGMVMGEGNGESEGESARERTSEKSFLTANWQLQPVATAT